MCSCSTVNSINVAALPCFALKDTFSASSASKLYKSIDWFGCRGNLYAYLGREQVLRKCSTNASAIYTSSAKAVNRLARLISFLKFWVSAFPEADPRFTIQSMMQVVTAMRLRLSHCTSLLLSLCIYTRGVQKVLRLDHKEGSKYYRYKQQFIFSI